MQFFRRASASQQIRRMGLLRSKNASFLNGLADGFPLCGEPILRNYKTSASGRLGVGCSVPQAGISLVVAGVQHKLIAN